MPRNKKTRVLHSAAYEKEAIMAESAMKTKH